MNAKHVALGLALALAACRSVDSEVRAPDAPRAGARTSPSDLKSARAAELAAWIEALRERELQPSGNPLDLAIRGAGFFRVRAADGEYLYTRDGAFRKDGSDVLCTSLGYPLDPQVQIPPDAIEVIVGGDGSVNVINSEAGLPEALTSVSLFRFADPDGLEDRGDELFGETLRSGAAHQVAPGVDGAGSIVQGYRERWNVGVVEQLAALILAQRIYEEGPNARFASHHRNGRTDGLDR